MKTFQPMRPLVGIGSLIRRLCEEVVLTFRGHSLGHNVDSTREELRRYKAFALSAFIDCDEPCEDVLTRVSGRKGRALALDPQALTDLQLFNIDGNSIVFALVVDVHHRERLADALYGRVSGAVELTTLSNPSGRERNFRCIAYSTPVRALSSKDHRRAQGAYGPR